MHAQRDSQSELEKKQSNEADNLLSGILAYLNRQAYLDNLAMLPVPKKGASVLDSLLSRDESVIHAVADPMFHQYLSKIPSDEFHTWSMGESERSSYFKLFFNPELVVTAGSVRFNKVLKSILRDVKNEGLASIDTVQAPDFNALLCGDLQKVDGKVATKSMEEGLVDYFQLLMDRLPELMEQHQEYFAIQIKESIMHSLVIKEETQMRGQGKIEHLSAQERQECRGHALTVFLSKDAESLLSSDKEASAEYSLLSLSDTIAEAASLDTVPGELFLWGEDMLSRSMEFTDSASMKGVLCRYEYDKEEHSSESVCLLLFHAILQGCIYSLNSVFEAADEKRDLFEREHCGSLAMEVSEQDVSDEESELKQIRQDFVELDESAVQGYILSSEEDKECCRLLFDLSHNESLPLVDDFEHGWIEREAYEGYEKMRGVERERVRGVLGAHLTVLKARQHVLSAKMGMFLAEEQAVKADPIRYETLADDTIALHARLDGEGFFSAQEGVGKPTPVLEVGPDLEEPPTIPSRVDSLPALQRASLDGSVVSGRPAIPPRVDSRQAGVRELRAAVVRAPAQQHLAFTLACLREKISQLSECLDKLNAEAGSRHKVLAWFFNIWRARARKPRTIMHKRRVRATLVIQKLFREAKESPSEFSAANFSAAKNKLLSDEDGGPYKQFRLFKPRNTIKSIGEIDKAFAPVLAASA